MTNPPPYEGSLDAPPLILRQSRARPITNLVVSVIGAVVLLGIFHGQGGPVVTVLLACLFALWTITGVAKLIWPDRLILDPQGVRYVWFGLTRRFRWRDISNFRIVQRRRAVDRLEFDSPKPGAGWRLLDLAKHIVGLASVPADWAVEDHELLGFLIEGRKRWVGDENQAPLIE